jgi:hypothetical protein
VLRTKAESTADINAKLQQRQSKYASAQEVPGADHSQDSEALAGKVESSGRAGRQVKGVEYYLSPGTPADSARDRGAPPEYLPRREGHNFYKEQQMALLVPGYAEYILS